MTRLEDRVMAALSEAGIRHAVIGAAAMAVWGVPRSTADFDLMVVAPDVFRADLWRGLTAEGAEVDIRKADASDPLAGVVRVEQGAEVVDVVVFGAHGWQAEVLARAAPVGATPPVVGVADWVLLKLYAGGPRDGWDIEALLSVRPDREAVAAQVEERLDKLPKRARQLWARVQGSGSAGS